MSNSIFQNDQPSVLCIDDDPEISRTLELRFRELPVAFHRAFHGMHGFWLAMTEQPDLIITDINMPQGHGDYVVECLKRNQETRNIPVIVLTGTRDAATKRRLELLGINAFFTKPCESKSLLAEAKKILGPKLATEATSVS